ncbi:MAG: UDP-N-acetylmuramoyl-L-alanine--D-glutamate ligase [Candidatus Tyrphobacter sp.]
MQASERRNLDLDTVLVVGLGKSGLASTAALRALGSRVIATDEKPRAQLADAIARVEAQGARFLSPSELDAVLAGVTLAVLSPGIPPASPVLQRIRAAGTTAIGEVELAWTMCAAPIVAITGTKGKSTTASLVTHLMRVAGKDARLGGNIGAPLVDAVAGATAQTWVVAELSSFQLETIVDLAPRISVLLNIAPDHLDRYATIDEYAAAKFRIFVNAGEGDSIVLDRDDSRLAALERRFEAQDCKASRFWYALREPENGLSMGLHGDDVVYVAQGRAPQPLFARGDLRLLGDHNLRNAMAASLAALHAGCDPDDIRAGVRSFRGLHHRLERVEEIDGVLYVDDSKATNPAAAAAALLSFDRPVLLIAGGRSKGTDVRELREVIARRAKATIAIGETAQEFAGIPGPSFERADSIEEAVQRARRLATPGDVVLLAPACASFDMFGSAEERGERFARAVRLLGEATHA